jgi:hypothetical protein
VIEAEFQSYWTAHELARFFFLMEDDHMKTVLKGPRSIIGAGVTVGGSYETVKVPGVQTWDACIDFLKDQKRFMLVK